jgi:LacI family transcriptional regulator
VSTKKPTIDDVATLSGVARTTVSRVINDGPNVRPTMRRRVMEAIDQLGYQVNVQARNLAAGNSRQIVLIHESNLEAEPNSYYHSGLELGALTSCAQHGYQLTTQAVDYQAGGWHARIMSFVESGRCDGLILPPPFSDEPDLVLAIMAADCPVVCISAGEAVRAIAPSIGIDDETAGYDMGRYLITLGHRRLAYIKGLEGHISAEGRHAGFVRALVEAGIDPASSLAARGNFTFRSGIECTERILEERDDVTVIVCANDDMAAGAMLVCHKHGLAIPARISVVGFDDTPLSDIMWPPLTTVHQPIKEIARRAASLLVKSIEGGGSGGGQQHQFVGHRIVERQSAASPP